MPGVWAQKDIIVNALVVAKTTESTLEVMIMKKGDFKTVSCGGKIIGVIHIRDDECYWAIAYGNGKTFDDAFDSEKDARKYIKEKTKKLTKMVLTTFMDDVL
jgi:hypothetical protein